MQVSKGLSQTEENYLKAIFFLSIRSTLASTSTNALAEKLTVKPASISAMLVKLKEKKLIHYEKYGKIKLSASGKAMALAIIRKHRLWELFLFKKLGFSWDEVHEVAEQLEHVHSMKLIDSLDRFLGYPRLDPHGDPIPDKEGRMFDAEKTILSECPTGSFGHVIGINDKHSGFLQYVTKLGLEIGSWIHVISKEHFDNSMEIEIGDKRHTVSSKFTESIWICSRCNAPEEVVHCPGLN